MAFAPSSTYFKTGDGSIIGSFREKSCGNYFEYSVNPDNASAVCEEMMIDHPHIIWVGGPGYGYRYATVKKTVAYVVVDEADNGDPIIEKWDIKARNVFQEAA